MVFRRLHSAGPTLQPSESTTLAALVVGDVGASMIIMLPALCSTKGSQYLCIARIIIVHLAPKDAVASLLIDLMNRKHRHTVVHCIQRTVVLRVLVTASTVLSCHESIDVCCVGCSCFGRNITKSWMAVAQRG